MNQTRFMFFSPGGVFLVVLHTQQFSTKFEGDVAVPVAVEGSGDLASGWENKSQCGSPLDGCCACFNGDRLMRQPAPSHFHALASAAGGHKEPTREWNFYFLFFYCRLDNIIIHNTRVISRIRFFCKSGNPYLNVFEWNTLTSMHPSFLQLFIQYRVFWRSIPQSQWTPWTGYTPQRQLINYSKL